MRYIVTEENPKDVSNPKVTVFAKLERAEKYATDSPNTCRIFRVGSSLLPYEVEDQKEDD